MKKIFLILIIGLPLGLFAQVDDPFAPPAGEDPFAPPPTETEVPAENQNPTPQEQGEVLGNEQQQEGNDPFAAPTEGGNPFSGGNNEGVPGMLDAQSNQTGSGIMSNLPDTLIQPLRPEFPWETKSITERQILDKYSVREGDVFLGENCMARN